MTVSNYSTTAINNTSINGVNISEGMSPSDVNNSIREQLKDVRSVWNDKEWFLLGDGDGTTTFTRASATSITVASDITSSYHVGRRIKIVGSNTGTIFGCCSCPAAWPSRRKLRRISSSAKIGDSGSFNATSRLSKPSCAK